MSGVLFVVCIPTHQQERRRPVPGESESEEVFVEVEPSNKCLSASSSRSLLNDDSTLSEKTVASTNLNEHAEGTMEKVLDELLRRLKIENAVWCTGRRSSYYQVLFSLGSGEIIEETLRLLHEVGIGTTCNSVVSVIPCSLYYEGIEQASMVEDSSEEGCKKDTTGASAWDKFVQSVRARLTVAQVVERVKSDACLTFDFLVLLLIAAVVSALGLVENSTIFLVASMLISPLMGPIMAGTFGTVIEDKRLQKMGVLNELFGLFICVLVGFVFGLAVGAVDENWGSEKLPTEEMMFRGEMRSLWVGVLIALPSGAAVAIALLGDNTGSLVGVAISASLLPPAVNAGLLWSLACVHQLWKDSSLISTNASVPLRSAVANSTAASHIYSEDITVELAALGAISLCLTLVNILCIFVTGILVLKVKEVSPRTSGKESQFWHHDIKIARDYNKTLNKEDGKQLEQQLADELAGFTDADFSTEGRRKFFQISPDRFNSLPHHFLPRHQQTWSPMMRQDNNRLTLQELESLYTTLTGHSPGTRHSGPWLSVPDSSTSFLPGWLRNHRGPQPHMNLTESGLPTIPESKPTPVVTGQASLRRVSLPTFDTRQAAKKKRFVVSAVDETSGAEQE